MHYFIYRITERPIRQLEKLEQHDTYREASARVKLLRSELPEGSSATIRMIHAERNCMPKTCSTRSVSPARNWVTTRRLARNPAGWMNKPFAQVRCRRRCAALSLRPVDPATLCRLRARRPDTSRRTGSWSAAGTWHATRAATSSMTGCGKVSCFALGKPRIDSPLPHGQEMRVQCGGLKGLQHTLDGNAEVTDVDRLLDNSLRRWGDLADLPYSEIVHSAASSYRGRRG